MKARAIILVLCGIIALLVPLQASAQTTTYGGSDTSWNNDDWNIPGNWDNGIPTGTIDVAIPASATASVLGSGGTPAYTGLLSMGANSSLHINNVADALALGTGVVMQAGARLILVGDSYTVPVPITLQGNAEMKISESTGGHHTSKTFTNSIQGAFELALYTGNNNTYNFMTNNFFEGLTLNAGNSRVDARGAGSLGVGNVTINNTATLRIYAAAAIDPSKILFLSGGRDTKLALTYDKLHLDVDARVFELWIDGVQQDDADYDNTETWLSGSGILTVKGPPVGTVITLY